MEAFSILAFESALDFATVLDFDVALAGVAVSFDGLDSAAIALWQKPATMNRPVAEINKDFRRLRLKVSA
ncbi:hypothetical protein GCM10011273_24160 [Asticcacaulis endophyticus]|uniref:Uncharacterized protein n=1 Tax=Asticcacaulis endophyticus TaxID=1395890 RepID=A0A918UVF4_9CAUL|nr:hypothetical protein GCM10011273_24160 [Asticcacaulis endophyticus]